MASNRVVDEQFRLAKERAVGCRVGKYSTTLPPTFLLQSLAQSRPLRPTLFVDQVGAVQHNNMSLASSYLFHNDFSIQWLRAGLPQSRQP
jgi:hypothetical protein